jgi:TetR/AcrR family transcriptional regulator, fatty acid metabolism regulator protein
VALNAVRKTARLAPEDRIAKILAAARAELSQRGYENFLPSGVAARCGVSEATIYRYFPTRRELLARVAEDWFGEILAVEPEIARRRDAHDQLRHLIRHSLAVVRREPALTRFVLTELRADPHYRSTKVYALNRRFTSSVITLVKDGVARGVFRPDASPSLVRDMIFGGIEHRTWNFLRGQGDFPVEEVADGIADLIFHGLARRSAPDADAIAAALAEVRATARALDGAAGRLERALDPTPRLPTD